MSIEPTRIHVVAQEIGMSFDLFCSPQSGVGGYLGCMTRWISDIYLNLDMQSIKSLNKKPIVTDSWGGSPAYAKVGEYLKTFVVPEERKAEIFKSIAESFNTKRPAPITEYGPKPAGSPIGPSFVLMADNINSWTPEFNKGSGISSDTKARNFKTSDFVLWLVKNKYGVVMGSPVARNQFHQDKENFSLTQAWIWIPPNFVESAVPGSFFISGMDKIPSQDKWREMTKKAIEKDISDEELDKRLWKGGRFNSHLEYL